MEVLEVGKRYENLAGRDGAIFTLEDSGATLMLRFRNPDESEKKEIEEGKIRYSIAYVNDIIWLFWKFGNLQYIETPYNFGQAKNLTKFQEIDEDKGFAVKILFVEGVTGELLNIRQVSLNTSVSKKIVEMINDQPAFTKEMAAKKIKIAQSFYTTVQLQKQSVASGII